MKNLLIILTIGLLIFPSCEKEIEIDVEDAPQQTVVEGVLRNYVGESYILISKSTGLYETATFEKVSGASVSVTEESGVVHTFTEDPSQPGKYILPSFQAYPNTKYDLLIVTNTETLTATSTSPSLPELDTLTYIVNPPGFTSTDTSYFLFYSFFDTPGEENYYRFKPSVNGEIDGNFYITNDNLGDGETTEQPFFGTEIIKGDSNDVKVEMISMDKANYKFILSWANAADQSPFSAAPGNPVSNINGSDNVVGYFGAFMIDTMSIYLP